MKKALSISITAHVALLLALWGFAWSHDTNVIIVPQIYNVQLISMPEPEIAPPVEEEPAPEVETIRPEPEEKKKLKPKPKEAEPRPKKKVEPKRDAKPSKATAESLIGIRSDEQFDFPYYIRIMTGKISSNWLNPYQGQDEKVTATVYFQVLRDGTITSSRVEKSSGISTFDRAALRAVVTSSPLPALPVEFAESKLTVHLDFEYAK